MRELTLQNDDISCLIYSIRGQKVMLDSDLADIYGVETRAVNLAVKRNLARFPIDFMFKLSMEEFENLKSQNVISKSLRSQSVILKKGRGQHRKYPPNVFTEHGTVMLATLLNSPQAIEASIFIVRAFVKMREFLAGHNEITQRVDELERKINELEEGHEEKFKAVFLVLRRLMGDDGGPRTQIGYKRKNEATD